MNNQRLILFAIMVSILLLIPSTGFGQTLELNNSDKIIIPKKTHKISSELDEQLQNHLKIRTFAASKFRSSSQTVQVYLTLNDSKSIRSLPNYVTIEHVQNKLVQARILESQIYQLENNSAVIQIQSPSYAIPVAVNTEALGLINANIAQSNNIKGNGVKVAVIDGGFLTNDPNISSNIVYTKSEISPPDITGGDTPGNSHGTAVAEIIVSIAPNVQLYLFNVRTSLDFNAAVDDAIAQHVNIISVSLRFFDGAQVGPGFRDGTSIVASKISQAYSSGIIPIIAAGNDAREHWYGQFQNSGIFLGSMPLNNFQPSATGVQKACLPFTINSGSESVILTWNNWPTTNQDYDLFVYDPTMTTLITSSTNPQSGTQTPWEQTLAISPGNYCAVIANFAASVNAFFHLYVFGLGNPGFITGAVASKSIGTPADSPNAIAVGAINSANQQLEQFSSNGPTDDGRSKPEICGPDNVTTSSYGLGPGFFGTSASAPEVAGIAALEIQTNPTLSTSALKQKILNDARSLSGLGTNLCGSGLTSISPSICLPPITGDWSISSSCTLATTASAPVNVIVRSGAVLTIPNGMRLNIDFTHYHLLVKSGGGVLIKAGGAIK